jgi:hypothetical protein
LTNGLIVKALSALDACKYAELFVLALRRGVEPILPALNHDGAGVVAGRWSA